MNVNINPVLRLISRQDTYVDYLSGSISQIRKISANIERAQQELQHRRLTGGQHLIDSRPSIQIEDELRINLANVRLILVQYVQTVHDISQTLLGFDPVTAMEVDVHVEVA